MVQSKMQPNGSETDPLIDEVRAIRRSICEDFGNDIEKLSAHLKIVEQEYRSRTGRFAQVPQQITEEIFPLAANSTTPLL